MFLFVYLVVGLLAYAQQHKLKKKLKYFIFETQPNDLPQKEQVKGHYFV